MILRGFLSLSLVLAGLPAFVPSDAEACTTFLLEAKSGSVVGKSYDWHDGVGLVYVNKKGVSKSALPFGFRDKPAKWTSKYASITFNQYGQEFPNGGMNEAGLVVEIMWLDSSVYPTHDKRPVVNELQWIQYQLDRFATVSEVTKNAEQIRVAPVKAKVHYLVCDKTDACATFEYVDGKLVVASGKTLPAKVLTNHTYAESTKHLSQHKSFGGKKDLPKESDASSLARFVRAASKVRKQIKKGAVQKAFGILDSVHQDDYTKWNIVYEPGQKRVHFRTTDNRNVKFVDLTSFDTSCKTPVKVFDLASKATGDVTKQFADMTREQNEGLIKASLEKNKGLPPGTSQFLASYPERLSCSL